MLVRWLDALLIRSSSLSRSLVSVYDVEELAADVAMLVAGSMRS